MKIDHESREILRYISEDFVMYATAGKVVAYHIATGDELGKEGFKHYCAKHYGDVLIYLPGKNEGDPDIEKRMPAGDTWWEWNDPERRVVRRIVMEPTSLPELDDNQEVFNRWHVLKESMAERDPAAAADSIAILANHLMYLSGGDVVGVTFFLCWLAQLYQTPEIKMPTAVLMYSKNTRIGKNLIQRLLTKVFGAPLVSGAPGSQLQKNFDDAIEHKRIFFINELARSDRTDSYENFKSQISEATTQFEGKGRASKEIKNITHYVVTTNHDDALPLMEKDGRIAVLRCTADRQPDAYYAELVAWIDGPGAGALAQILATWRFPKDWDPYAPVPQTAAVRAMQAAARGPLVCLLDELVEDGIAPFDKDVGRIMDLIPQLDTAFTALLRGSKLNGRTLPAALERLGYAQLPMINYLSEGIRKTARVWCWRNKEKWINATGQEVAVAMGLAKEEKA